MSGWTIEIHSLFFNSCYPMAMAGSNSLSFSHKCETMIIQAYLLKLLNGLISAEMCRNTQINKKWFSDQLHCVPYDSRPAELVPFGVNGHGQIPRRVRSFHPTFRSHPTQLLQSSHWRHVNSALIHHLEPSNFRCIRLWPPKITQNSITKKESTYLYRWSTTDLVTLISSTRCSTCQTSALWFKREAFGGATRAVNSFRNRWQICAKEQETALSENGVYPTLLECGKAMRLAGDIPVFAL